MGSEGQGSADGSWVDRVYLQEAGNTGEGRHDRCVQQHPDGCTAQHRPDESVAKLPDAVVIRRLVSTRLA